KLASQMRHPLRHAYQSKAADAASVEYVSVVVDAQQESATLLTHYDGHFCGLGMFYAVAQGFLRNSIHTTLMRLWQTVGNLFGSNLHRKIGAFADFACLPFEGRDKSQVIEHGRTEQ